MVQKGCVIYPGTFSEQQIPVGLLLLTEIDFRYFDASIKTYFLNCILVYYLVVTNKEVRGIKSILEIAAIVMDQRGNK